MSPMRPAESFISFKKVGVRSCFVALWRWQNHLHSRLCVKTFTEGEMLASFIKLHEDLDLQWNGSSPEGNGREPFFGLGMRLTGHPKALKRIRLHLFALECPTFSLAGENRRWRQWSVYWETSFANWLCAREPHSPWWLLKSHAITTGSLYSQGRWISVGSQSLMANALATSFFPCGLWVGQGSSRFLKLGISSYIVLVHTILGNAAIGQIHTNQKETREVLHHIKQIEIENPLLNSYTTTKLIWKKNAYKTFSQPFTVSKWIRWIKETTERERPFKSWLSQY